MRVRNIVADRAATRMGVAVHIPDDTPGMFSVTRRRRR